MSVRNGCVTLVVLATLVLSVPGHTEPSAAAAAALNTHLTEARVPSHALAAVRCLLEAAGLRLNVGVELRDAGKWELENVSMVPAGTLKEQLDCLARAGGYEWQVNGDWLNFYPKSVAEDPDYVMNKRIPGEVVVTPGSGSTDIQPWMKANGIQWALLLLGVQTRVDYSKIAGNKIVLKDSTFREHTNAHYTVYGVDGYSVLIQQKPDRKNPGKTVTLMTWTHSRIWDPPLLTPTSEGISNPPM